MIFTPEAAAAIGDWHPCPRCKAERGKPCRKVTDQGTYATTAQWLVSQHVIRVPHEIRFNQTAIQMQETVQNFSDAMTALASNVERGLRPLTDIFAGLAKKPPNQNLTLRR